MVCFIPRFLLCLPVPLPRYHPVCPHKPRRAFETWWVTFEALWHILTSSTALTRQLQSDDCTTWIFWFKGLSCNWKASASSLNWLNFLSTSHPLHPEAPSPPKGFLWCKFGVWPGRWTRWWEAERTEETRFPVASEGRGVVLRLFVCRTPQHSSQHQNSQTPK